MNVTRFILCLIAYCPYALTMDPTPTDTQEAIKSIPSMNLNLAINQPARLEDSPRNYGSMGGIFTPRPPTPANSPRKETSPLRNRSTSGQEPHKLTNSRQKSRSGSHLYGSMAGTFTPRDPSPGRSPRPIGPIYDDKHERQDVHRPGDKALDEFNPLELSVIVGSLLLNSPKASKNILRLHDPQTNITALLIKHLNKQDADAINQFCKELLLKHKQNNEGM